MDTPDENNNDDEEDEPDGLLVSLRQLPSAAWLLFLGTFINKFGGFVMPFLARMMDDQGFTKGETGMALGAYGVGHLFASWIGGYLADHIGRRKTITLSMYSGAVAIMALSQADSLVGYVVFAMLSGLTCEIYRPASSALLADLVPEKLRVTAFATHRLAFNLGWAIGIAAAGFLAEISFMWLFVGEAITCVGFGALAWFALPKGVRGKAGQGAGWGVAFRHIRRDRNFIALLASYVAIGFVFMQMGTSYGVFLKEIGYAARTYGLLLFVNGIVVVLVELPLIQITQRFSPKRVIALGYAVMGVGFGTMAFGHSMPVLLLAILLFSIGEVICSPIASGYVSKLAPPDMRGRYMGMVGFTWAGGMIVWPWIGLHLLGIDAAALWGMAGGFGILAALIVMLCLDARPSSVGKGSFGQK